ncbi:NAD-dependent epimerase/dehydratase family protein [Catellicoccus marimammalium]|uniref:NAD-dependent epimerase/dehydratase n=1 Tax=Catellicoccus marimammalium M35/04/3 TaxID=1234409 RepID=K8Z8F1_9ENTE|nr:NAD(P)-dependent oxidoreductase [Catellicoccus marimammalium]EKU27130.1 NAD-dependent epimerase/dehydratase [Catellicoccus marimammalium M35/04/3]
MNKVFVLGGTGFLGYYTVQELLKKGIAVKTLSLPPKEDAGTITEENPLAGLDNVEILVNDINAMSDEDVVEMLKDCDGFVYGAGADERVQAKAPAKRFYYEANVLPTQRMVRLAGKAGVKHFVIFGSYFSEMAERFPDLGIQDSPYINTRLLQEQLGFAEGEGIMDVTVIRLPYIFGTMKNRMPLWQMFVDRIRDNAVYPVFKGGTACVTAKQVGQAAVGALLHGKHRQTFAIGDTNLSYEEFATIIKEELNVDTEIKVLTFDEGFPMYKQMDETLLNDAGREYGIPMETICRVQQEYCYLNYNDTFPQLGVEKENIREVFRETIRYILELENK